MGFRALITWILESVRRVFRGREKAEEGLSLAVRQRRHAVRLENLRRTEELEGHR